MDTTDNLVIGYTRDKSGHVIGRHLNALSNTLNCGGGTTAQFLLEPQVLQLTPRSDGLSNAITTVTKDNLLMQESQPTYRIRKFTPRECFRLMGVSEDYIDLIQSAGISNSQQFKMAGNSIVVDVLFHIFRKMFHDTADETPNSYADLFTPSNCLPIEQYSYDSPLRVVTAFSGYDSQCMALDRLRKLSRHTFSYELLAWSEIDRYAIQAHNAVYPQYADRNLGDIARIDWSSVPDFDLFTYSFPCTDISSAGLQKGLSENSGTRSGLLWECRKAIDIKRPRFLLMENVAALTQRKFMPEFKKWQDYLTSCGYTNFWQVLNAKDYGIPQNRPRVFMVSMLDKDTTFHWPAPFPLEHRIKDIIDTHVDERFYIKPERIEGLNLSTIKQTEGGNGFKFVPKTTDDGNHLIIVEHNEHRQSNPNR